MKTKHIFLTVLLAAALLFGLSVTAGAYSVMLPDVMPTPGVPYIADMDHYNAAAVVQMVLNSCPDTAARTYHADQTVLYNRIQAHNSEPAIWFSGPDGVRGALMDPILSPCGNWSDYSNTDKAVAMGKILYWMKARRYMTPVSVGAGEKWMAIWGYHSDVEPSSTTSIVTLNHIFLYDPTPGAASPSLMLSGATWLSNASYWGVPFNNAASSWHNKYISIVEPPKYKVVVRWPEYVLRGEILPPDRIREYYFQWVKKIRAEDVLRGPFERLAESPEPRPPILVDALKYKYYIVPLEDPRIVAIFNAYNGEFEELRIFNKEQEYITEPGFIHERMAKTFEMFKVKEFKFIREATLRYSPKLASVGRFSPTWQVGVYAVDATGKEMKFKVYLNTAGQVIRGLDKLSVPVNIKDSPIQQQSRK